jgi:hypothetical protein
MIPQSLLRISHRGVSVLLGYFSLLNRSS